MMAQNDIKMSSDVAARSMFHTLCLLQNQAKRNMKYMRGMAIMAVSFFLILIEYAEKACPSIQTAERLSGGKRDGDKQE